MSRRAHAGFALVEIMVVVVVMGILALIAIGNFGDSKDKALLATMTSDLRNLTTTEEAYLTDNQAYVGVTAVAPATVDGEPKCG